MALLLIVVEELADSPVLDVTAAIITGSLDSQEICLALKRRNLSMPLYPLVFRLRDILSKICSATRPVFYFMILHNKMQLPSVLQKTPLSCNRSKMHAGLVKFKQCNIYHRMNGS